MTDQKPPVAPVNSPRSPNDEQTLNYLAVFSAFLQQQLDQSQPKERKTFAEALKEPAVVAALVTVLIGGIAATAITGIIQWRAGVREFNQAWLKSRGDQALLSYKDYLDQEQELMRRTYALIGTSISASDRLVGLTKATWRQQFVGPELQAVQKQMKDIRSNYNEVNAKWNSEVEELGLLMGYYHPGQPQVYSSWRAVKENVTAYQQCAQNWYETHPATKPAPSDEEANAACKPRYKDLLASLSSLTDSLESVRRYAWTGWESPEKIRSLVSE